MKPRFFKFFPHWSDQIEPTRHVKERFWAVPHEPCAHGDFTNPGICPRPLDDRISTAILAETIDFLATVSMCVLTASPVVMAFGAGAIETVGAVAADAGAAESNKRECALRLARGEAAKAAIMAGGSLADKAGIVVRKSRLHGLARFLGVAMLATACGAKVLNMLASNNRLEASGAAVAVTAALLTAGVLRFLSTGPGLAQLRLLLGLDGMLRDYFKAEDPTQHPCHIKTFREYDVRSSVELAEAHAGRHALVAGEYDQATNIYRATLRTWGLLFNDQLHSMVSQQRTPEQKDALSRAGVRHQIEILTSDPLCDDTGPSNVVPYRTVTGPPPMSASARQEEKPTPVSAADGPNGSSPEAPHPAVRVGARMAAIVTLALGLGLSGCKDDRAVDLPMRIGLAMPLAEKGDAPLRPPLLEVLTPPKQPYGDRFFARPEFERIDLGGAPQQLDTSRASKTWRDFMTGIFGSKDKGRLLDRRRREFAAAPVDKLALPADASVTDVPQRVAQWVAKQTGKGAHVLAFTPANDDSAPSQPAKIELADGREIPRHLTVASVRAAIEAALKQTKDGKVPAFAILYGRVESLLPAAEVKLTTIQEKVAPPAEIRTLRIATIPSGGTPLMSIARGFLASHSDAPVGTQEGATKTVVTGEDDGVPAKIEIVAGADPVGLLANRPADAMLIGRSLTAAELKATAGLGDLSRREAEHYPGIQFAIVCVVKDSPLRSLTVGQVAQIFSGKAQRWEELVPDLSGPIRAHAAGDEGAACEVLSQKAGIRVSGVQRHGSEESVAGAVANDRNAIGLVSRRIADSVRPLAVADDEKSPAFEATDYNVATSYYPLARRLRFVVPPAGKDPGRTLAERFAAYAESTAGQSLLARAGLMTEAIRIETPSRPTPVKAASAVPAYDRVVAGAEPINLAIRFATNDAALDNYSLQAAERLVELLKSSPGYSGGRLVLAGFADGVGSEPRNQWLSEQRARAVADFLRLRGVTPEVVAGFGSKLCVASNGTEAGRALNRRVEIWIKRSAATAAAAR